MSQMIDAGVVAIWLPVFNHVITVSTVGTYRRLIDGENAAGWAGPLPWDKALKLGHYNLDENGELKAEVREIVRICADRNVALFFGHAIYPEISSRGRSQQGRAQTRDHRSSFQSIPQRLGGNDERAVPGGHSFQFHLG